MALTSPPGDLNSRDLPLVRVMGTLFRISHKKYPNPIFWSQKGVYRFDSPTALYGVLYTGRTFETSLLEVFGDQWAASRTISHDYLADFTVCEIKLAQQVQVANLSGEHLNPLGTDSNIFASTDYALTQQWAAAFMTHPTTNHGIRYPSRKNQKLHNFALFRTDSVTKALSITKRYPLLKHTDLFGLLDTYKVDVI